LQQHNHPATPIGKPDGAAEATESGTQILSHMRSNLAVPTKPSENEVFGGVQLAIDPDGQTFSCELVDDVQQAIFSPVMGSILSEIIGPDRLRMLGPQMDVGPVIKPEPLARLR